MYDYYLVNVSRAVGPRIVDRVINNLSNDSEMLALQYASRNNFLGSRGSRDIELSRDTYVRFIGPQSSRAMNKNPF